MKITHDVYRIFDSNPTSCIRINPKLAKKWNEKGFGIFFTINAFNGPRRIANLKKILGWSVDMDYGTKKEMMAKIKKGLVPSLIIETKRGFHVYWLAKDAKLEHWDSIMSRLIKFYNSDPSAKDFCKMLRLPGYFHWKDPQAPFLVREVFKHNVSYTEKQMAMFYPEATLHKKATHESVRKKYQKFGNDFWENVWNLDCEQALIRLSGHDAVQNEVFEFKQTNTGKNIWVNGKCTSCWIDKEGKIGSLSNGGPTIAFWIKWYGHSWPYVVSVLKSVFPELENKK